MCACSKEAKGNVLNNCLNTTVSTLQIYKAKYECIRDNNLYNTIGKNSLYIVSRIDLLNTMINDKINDPGSCNNFQYLSYIENEINYITTVTSC